MDLKGIVFSTARDGRLHQMKAFLDDKSGEELFSLVSARTNGATPLVIACRNGHLDVALYLVERCNADIEQVGAVTLDKIIVKRAPPLWCAAAAGHLNIVKMLVTYNASVNSTTERNSTALRAACCGGQFGIVKYLIQNGADFEIANEGGDTCLMYTCFMGYDQFSKYLLECGADINRKTVDGNTALHDCAQRGNLDMLKLLLQSGAKSYCNSFGTTPLLEAAFAGHSKVVEYLIHEFSCTKQEKVDALELLGSAFILEHNDIVKAFEFWIRAMELRYEDDEFPLEKPTTRFPIASCIDATEARTLHQLEELVDDPDEMYIQSVLVAERILGPCYKDIFHYIIFIGIRYRNNGNFHKCMRVWMYALDLQLQVQEPLNYWTLELLSRFAVLFSFMILERLERGLKPVLFQDILHVFERSLKIIEKDLYVPTARIVENYTSLLHDTLITVVHMVGLMCTLQPHLNIYENTELRKAVYKLVRLNRKGKNGWTLLHVACYKDTSSLGDSCLSITEFPSPEVVCLLLEVGACPNAVDAGNNTPLHVAAMNMPCAPTVFKELLNHGAHLDLCNFERKTPLQLAETKLSLAVYPLRYVNLQCLCAQAVRNHEIDYEGQVHETLKELLDSH